MNWICSANALRALHRVMVCTRFAANEGCEAHVISDVMDSAEYLVAILQNHEERTERECLREFRSYLKDLETRFPGYEGLLAAFDSEPQSAKSRPLLATRA